MCEPVTIALTVGSALASYEGQRKMAKAQKGMNARNYDAAVKTNERDQARLDRREREELVSAAQKEFDILQDAKKLKATQMVQSGEAGVSVGSISVADVLGDLEMQKGQVITRNNITMENKLAALQDDRDKVYANMVSRINNLPIVHNPDFLGTALEVGSGLAADYDWSSGSPKYRT